MPAVNLLFVNKDSAFNCYDLITGYTKKIYTIQSTIPDISDALQPNSILVLTAHCNASGKVDGQLASAYATSVLTKIAGRDKITRIVYFMCSANAGVSPMNGKVQLAPTAVVHLEPPNLKVDGFAGDTPNNIIKYAADTNGWIYNAAAD